MDLLINIAADYAGLLFLNRVLSKPISLLKNNE
jgi:hypothetical protein